VLCKLTIIQPPFESSNNVPVTGNCNSLVVNVEFGMVIVDVAKMVTDNVSNVYDYQIHRGVQIDRILTTTQRKRPQHL
jgi:hypothetical protein